LTLVLYDILAVIMGESNVEIQTNSAHCAGDFPNQPTSKIKHKDISKLTHSQGLQFWNVIAE